MQLIQLRDHYRKGWEPDYADDQTSKYVILLYENEICREQFHFFNHVLSFQSEQIRDEFANNFKDLIKIANELDNEVENTNISDVKTWDWEKFCLDNPINKGECYIDIVSEIKNANIGSTRYCDKDKNVLPNKKTAEAFLALMQLIQLRNCYRQGWEPDWTSFDKKYTISFCRDGIYCDIVYGHEATLSFQSPEIRREFLRNFKDLIIQAKDLI